MRFLSLLVALVALVGAAPPSIDFESFNRALETSDHEKAAAIIDGAVRARTPADGRPRPDPLLNALIGRYLIAAQKVEAALAYLERADPTELSPPLRGQTLLAYATALERVGNRDRALDAFNAAASTATPHSAINQEALLGAARQLIVSDPARARQILLPLAEAANPARRWEAFQLLAITASLSGDSRAAAQFADRAWADAVSAKAADLAPAKVAVLRAGLAANLGNKAGKLAMLEATNAGNLTRTAELLAQLPVCGDDGVKPADHVTFGIVVGPFDTNALFPIAASRSAIVKPFYDRLAGRRLVVRAGNSGVNGTIVTLSCRAAVSSDFAVTAPATDLFLEWMVENGIYPAQVRLLPDGTINRISSRMDELEARFGANSPLLLQPTFELLSALQIRAVQGDDVSAGRLADLRNQLSAAMRRFGAPTWMAELIEWQNRIAVSLANASPAEAEELMLRQLAIAPFSVTGTLIRAATMDLAGDLPAPIARSIEKVADKVPDDLPARARQAWLLTLARAKRSLGRNEEAEAVLKEAGLNSRLCASMVQSPKLLEQHFDFEDYPVEFMVSDQTGLSAFEIAIGADGKIISSRLVASMPSGLFDEVTSKGLDEIRFTPARRDGRDVPCDGEVQSVVWRLQDMEELSLPPLVSGPTGDRT